MSDDKHLTPKDISAELKISVDQVKKLIERGHIPAVNVGIGDQRRYWRVSREDLDGYLTAQRAATASRIGGGAA